MSNRFTYYEKSHLHDHVYSKKEVDAKIPQRIFYRGHCKHNNNRKVSFYPNTDVGFSVNVTQSDNNHFVCDSNDDKKLLIKMKGLYILTFTDGYKCSRSCNFRIKMDKISHDVNVSSYYVQNGLPASSSWKTMSFTTVVEVDDDTNIELFIDNNTAILDGLSYSYLTIYRLTE